MTKLGRNLAIAVGAVALIGFGFMYHNKPKLQSGHEVAGHEIVDLAEARRELGKRYSKCLSEHPSNHTNGGNACVALNQQLYPKNNKKYWTSEREVMRICMHLYKDFNACDVQTKKVMPELRMQGLAK